MNFDYIAGFIDGEGSFTIASQKYYFHPRFSVAQNTKDVLEEMQMVFAKHNIRSTIYKNIHKPRGNIWYNLRIQDRESLSILCDLLDGRLFVKAKQLSVFDKFLQIKSGDATRTNTTRRNNDIDTSKYCREKIMSLNKIREV